MTIINLMLSRPSLYNFNDFGMRIKMLFMENNTINDTKVITYCSYMVLDTTVV